MMQRRILKAVVASPNDVQAERDCLEDAVTNVNQWVAKERGLHIELARWETDAFPGFHVDGPQGLIDPLLRIEDCDVLIGIFWKRFGTPVTDADSGTEHEIKMAYEAWKRMKRPHIMIYFNQQPHTPTSKAETDQWGQVLDFRRHFPKEGLWWEYHGKDDFQKKVTHHLVLFIQHTYPISGAILSKTVSNTTDIPNKSATVPRNVPQTNIPNISLPQQDNLSQILEELNKVLQQQIADLSKDVFFQLGEEPQLVRDMLTTFQRIYRALKVEWDTINTAQTNLEMINMYGQTLQDVLELTTFLEQILEGDVGNSRNTRETLRLLRQCLKDVKELSSRFTFRP